jgi:hypothetical protein
MKPEHPFVPIIAVNGDCRGHLLYSAKGWRLLDREDREIGDGTYPTPDAAVAALLEHETTG